MGLVQCVVITLSLCAQLVLTSPIFYTDAKGRSCRLCPAGEYQKSCNECEPCAAGWFTTDLNREDSCHPCYGDCRPELHLKVVQSCTRTSDVKCVCQDGYKCTEEAPLSKHCKECTKIREETTTEAATITPSTDKHKPSTTSAGNTRSSDRPCKFPQCKTATTVSSAGNGTQFQAADNVSRQMAAIFCPVVVIGLLALLILFVARRPADESCFKGAIAKLHNEGGKDASHKPKVSTHQFPTDSFGAKQQPSSLSAANLGPVHVHNPGTVIFSLLSHFTGQVGPTIEAVKTDERGSSEEEDERDCRVFHPTSSPSIHLSEEERSGEIDSIFFPSQEQGKDCHVSKEEVL